MKYYDPQAFALRTNTLHFMERWAFSSLLLGGILILLLLNPFVLSHKWLMILGLAIGIEVLALESQYHLTRRGVMAALSTLFVLLGLGVTYQTNGAFIFCHVGVAAIIALFLLVMVFRTK